MLKKIKQTSSFNIYKSLKHTEETDNVHLTPAIKTFMVELYNIFTEYGFYDEVSDSYYIDFSYSQLSNLTQFSYNLVVLSMVELCKCGILVRFVSLDVPSYTGNKNKKKFLTFISKDFYNLL